LYYRLNVLTLNLPRLADRIEDIPLLAGHCLKLICERTSTDAKSLAPDAIALLVSHDWPGNIRQLFNVVEQTAALSSSTVISADVVRKALGLKTAVLPSLSEARDEFTRGYLLHLLAATEGNVTLAARLAQRNRTDFYKLLARHDIDPASFKS
jgi:two-component system response regulator GlrR